MGDGSDSGREIHLITDRNGLPLSLGISGADMHDSLGLKPLVGGIAPIRSRRGPRRRRPAKLHTDKGYDYNHLRRWLPKRGIRHRIARKGIESSQRLGRHRWVVERTVRPGSPAVGACTAATSARPNISWPSSASLQP